MLHVILHVVGLVVLCAVIPIHLLSMHQLIHFSPVCEVLVDAHTAFIVRKWTCEVLSLQCKSALPVLVRL